MNEGWVADKAVHSDEYKKVNNVRTQGNSSRSYDLDL